MARMNSKPFNDDQAMQIICALISAGRIRTIGTLDTTYINKEGDRKGLELTIDMSDTESDTDTSGRDAHYLRALFHELTRPEDDIS